MRIAIFSRPGCRITEESIKLFHQQNMPISFVIEEMDDRSTLSASEVEFRHQHRLFREWLSTQKKIRFQGLKKRFTKVLQRFELKSKKKVPVIYMKRHSSEDTRKFLEENEVSYVLLASSSWLIKEPLLSMLNTKIINVHPAFLPKHRSLDSLPWSILEGDPIGLTAHFVDAGIDTGPILLFQEVVPKNGENLITLRERMNKMIPNIFLKVILGFRDKTIVPVPQKIADGKHHRPMSLDELRSAEHCLQKRLRA